MRRNIPKINCFFLNSRLRFLLHSVDQEFFAFCGCHNLASLETCVRVQGDLRSLGENPLESGKVFPG